jgi:hypothetical protein
MRGFGTSLEKFNSATSESNTREKRNEEDT